MPELTAELLSSLWAPQEVVLSPDGRRAAWSAAPQGRAGADAESAIWMASVDGASPARRWTHGGCDTHPRWSPDGARLAFLSDRGRPGRAGLYVMDLAGGEARPLVVRSRSIARFDWSPDGGRIAFLAADDPGEEDERRERERDDADVHGERWQRNRLHVVAADGGEPAAVETGDGHVTDLAWSPDGRRLAYMVQPTPEQEARWQTAIAVVPVDGGEARTVARGMAIGLAWSDDGRRLLYGAPHEPGTVGGFTLWSVDPDGGQPAVIGPSPDDPCCGFFARRVRGARRIVALTAQGLDTRLEWRDPAHGAAEPLYETEGGFFGFDAVLAGHGEPVIALVEATPRLAAEVLAGPPGALRRLSDHNADLDGIQLAVAERFGWRAPDGLDLDGVLLRPPGAGPGPLPTVVLVHGGPYGRADRSVALHALRWEQWLAAAGYAVLLPNYRGGLGRGHRFALAARGGVGGAEFDDVMSAVDAAVERGVADPGRLGIGGWSQGGFLSAWAVTQTDRFRAGVMGAGISHWGMLTMTSDIPTGESELAGSRPWDGPGPHRADLHSPISYAARVRTPLLLLHGQQDVRIPVGQARAFHHALRAAGVPAELVTYPREGHLIQERRHQQDLLRRVRDWFDRWLS